MDGPACCCRFRPPDGVRLVPGAAAPGGELQGPAAAFATRARARAAAVGMTDGADWQRVIEYRGGEAVGGETRRRAGDSWGPWVPWGAAA